MKMSVIAQKLAARITKYYKLYISRDPFELTLRKWIWHQGDATLRLEYPLSEESIVFDVGGYKGEWSEAIQNRYNPYLLIFEPVPTFHSIIVAKFRDNSKARVFNFGLFDCNCSERLSVNNDSSSLFRSGSGCFVDTKLVDIHDFLADQDIKHIDLIKINIEGAEYRLLTRMVERHIVERCRDIQVQFHSFYPNAIQLRSQIREALKRTHHLTFDYPFVWENWRLRSELW